MGRDLEGHRRDIQILISIHSPRMGRDFTYGFFASSSARFQSTLPAWGETEVNKTILRQALFQSTLPAWGETALAGLAVVVMVISIHSPRMGRDAPTVQKNFTRYPFQSTLPAWGETFLIFC